MEPLEYKKTRFWSVKRKKQKYFSFVKTQAFVKIFEGFLSTQHVKRSVHGMKYWVDNDPDGTAADAKAQRTNYSQAILSSHFNKNS